MESSKQIGLINIQAVHDKNLRSILDEFQLSERIDSGTLLCEFCAQPISWDNIGALLVRGGRIAVCCALVDCIGRAASLA